MPIDAAISPPKAAKRYAVGVHTVLAWIKSGELVAINVGSGAMRPRWRIMPDAIADFERRRQATPATKATRRRRKVDPGVIEYF